MGENEGAAPAAPDPAVALVIPVIVIVDMTEYAAWHADLYTGEDVPDPEVAVREQIDEAVGVMRANLAHVDGISIGFGPSDLVDDAPDGL